jgi:hypothetical protein
MCRLPLWEVTASGHAVARDDHQLTKHYNVLRHITSDLATFPRITKILMIPNISTAQLQSVLASNVSFAAVSSDSGGSYRQIRCNMREIGQWFQKHAVVTIVYDSAFCSSFFFLQIFPIKFSCFILLEAESRGADKYRWYFSATFKHIMMHPPWLLSFASFHKQIFLLRRKQSPSKEQISTDIFRQNVSTL